MSITRAFIVSLIAYAVCVLARPAAAGDLATHLFVLKDGQVYSYGCGNHDETLKIGKQGKKSVAWLTFQTGGFDAATLAGASLTLHVSKVSHQGTLKVFALAAPVPKSESQVGPYNLNFNYNAPIASLSITSADSDKLIRLDLGQILSSGNFHGLVLGSTNGLVAEFNSKDSDIQPMIELRHAFVSAQQLETVLQAAAGLDSSITSALNSAASAADDADDAAGSAQASAASAANAATSAAQAAVSAGASAAGAAQADAGAATAAASAVQADAGAATSTAGAIASAAGAAASEGSAVQSAAGATASAANAASAGTSASQAETHAAAAQSAASAAAASAAAGQGHAAASAQSAAASQTSAGAAAGSVSSAQALVDQITGVAQGATNIVAQAQAYASAAASAAGQAVNAAQQADSHDAAALAAATAASSHASQAALSATEANTSAVTVTSMIQAGTIFPPGTILMNLNAVPFQGFSATGIRVNYELPWGATHAPTVARSEMASAVSGGRLYSAGGTTGAATIATVQAFNPLSGTWTTVSGLQFVTRRASMVEHDGMLYLLGGMNSAGASHGNCQRYDVASNSWSVIAPMPARWGHASAYFNGKIYVFGGYANASMTPMTVTSVYDIASNSWSDGSPLPTWRALMQAREVGGRIFVMGGSVSGALSPVNEAYDPAADSWTTLAALPGGRANYGAVADDARGRIYLMGGETLGATNTCLQYEVAANSWVQVNSMNQARQAFAAGLIGTKIYISQGMGAANLSTTEEYSLPKTVYLMEKL